MKTNEEGLNQLKEELDSIINSGIKADIHHLKKDMCSQFSDYREWIREYVVNAYDAQAGYCKISGKENGNLITITVKDNGHGMDKQGLIDFFTLYRSVKKGDPGKVIGKHGIGKLSVAAIPGQCKLVVITSNAKETWKAEAGALLEEHPIKIEPVKDNLPQGTTFEITYKKEYPIKQEMKKIYEILLKYARYLPMDIIVSIYNDKIEDEQFHLVHEEWLPLLMNCGKAYQYSCNGTRFYISVKIGNGAHEVFQNRVFITSNYNLLSHDLKENIILPYITIYVDSPDFELPFGRHCLRNEEILNPLSLYIRQCIIPDYINSLKNVDYTPEMKCLFNSYMLEELASYMLKYFKDDTNWIDFPLFRDYNGNRYSLINLLEKIKLENVLYLEDKSDTGIDYSIFQSPVLSQNQPGIALEVLKEVFNEALVNLSLNDVIIEAPSGNGNMLTEDDKNFEKYLYFYPENIDLESLEPDNKEGNPFMLNAMITEIKNEKFDGVCEEIKSSGEELKKIIWRINYLVERDGKTPCKSHRFLYKSDTVILNLNHPEIRQLVKLSKTAPALAGHWAIALCMTDSNKVLSHLTPEAREELLLIDAMSKIGLKNYPATLKTKKNATDNQNQLKDLMKRANFYNNFNNN